MQERIRYAHQTPLFFNGFGVTHEILVQPQMRLTLLIEGFNRPADQVGGDAPSWTPVHPISDQHDIGAGSCCILQTDDQALLAQFGNVYG